MPDASLCVSGFLISEIMKSIDENYVTIQGWMLSKLNLKGARLMTFALIYGFCQDGKSRFRGSVAYIAEWTGTSDRQVQNVLNELQSDNLIVKLAGNVNGIDTNEYTINFKEVEKLKNRTGEKTSPVKKLTNTPEKTSPVPVKKLHPTGEIISPNNIEDNISDNIVDKDSISISKTDEEIPIDPQKPDAENLNADDVQTLKNDIRDSWKEKATVFIEQMHTDGEKLYFIEPLQRRTGFSEQQIFEAAREFATDQIAKEDFYRYLGYKDFKSHFYNWLPLNAKRLAQEWEKDKKAAKIGSPKKDSEYYNNSPILGYERDHKGTH